MSKTDEAVGQNGSNPAWAVDPRNPDRDPNRPLPIDSIIAAGRSLKLPSRMTKAELLVELEALQKARLRPQVAKKTLEEKLAEAKARGVGKSEKSTTLSPFRHPQKDFFVADISDASIKDDLASMEHPLFALQAGDRRVKKYERNGNTLSIKPGSDGCATIHDKDIWIYCISQLVEAMNRGRVDVSRTVRFVAHDFLVTTNRDTSGRAYERLAEALGRLSGTRIETNIVTGDQRERAGFGLVDSWTVIEKTAGGRMVAVEVTLPDWLHRSVLAKQVLTLSPDYFRIRKPIDRRIYELVRKHCGKQTSWQCTVKTLHEKSGSTDVLRNFRAALVDLANTNELPGFRVAIESDLVTFSKR